MATDVSIRVGVDGEKEFRTALNGINSQIKNLDSEMKMVVSSLSGMDDAEEKVAKQTDVLGRSIEATKQKISTISAEYDRQKKKLDELGTALDEASSAEYKSQAEREKAITKATNAYNQQAKKVSDLGTDINKATTQMNRMEKELRDIETGADKAGNALDDLGKDADSTGRSLRDAFTIGAVSGGIQSLINTISGVISETSEYRKIMGTLEVSSQKAGYSAEQTAESYQQLYGVIGDDQQSATALANLQALGVSQEQLSQFVDGAVGAWATYGDSIPIDSLAEAINETVQAGTVTGTFADVLNWAGTNEDEFNEKLAACKTESERANVVLQELQEQGLMGAAEAWRENNKEIVEANKAQGELNDSLASIGKALSPLVSMLTNGLAAALEAIQPGIQFIIDNTPVIIGALIGIAGAVAAMNIGKIVGLLGSIGPAITGIVTAIGGPATVIVAIISGIVGAIIGLWNTNDAFREAVISAWETIKSKFETVVTVIQNFFTVTLPNAIDTAITWFSELPGRIQDFLSQVIKKVVNWGSEMISHTKTAAQNTVDAVVEFFSELPGKIWDWLLQVVQKIVQWGQEMIKNAKSKMKETVDAILNTLRELPDKVVKIGKDVIVGLWNGISEKVEWVKEKIQGVVDGIKNVFTNVTGFFTGSPSKWSRKIGAWIMQGLGIGIKKDNTAKRSAAAAVKNIKAIILDTADKLIEALIDKEKKLTKKLEDTGLDEATKTALTNQLNIVKEFRSEYESALADIQKSQESMANKLQDYGDLFTTVKNETGSFLELGDLQADIDAIERYGDALEQLKSRGVSESLLDEITSLNVDEALAYTDQLLSMTDEEYSDYMALWEKKQAEAQAIAKKFYSDEMEALQKEFVDKIPQELSDVKSEMQNIGANSIQGMIEGMYAKSGALWSAAKNIISQAINAMRTEADIHSPSGKTAELVGAPMGEGVAVGFFAGLRKSRAAIESAVMQPIDRINRDDMYKVAAATVNGMAMTGGAWTQTVVIPVNLNGKQIAEVVFDPLRNISKQRGVALS